MTDKTIEAFERYCEKFFDIWSNFECWQAATAEADAEIRRWKARCIAAENGHPQVKEATSAADARYMPVIEKLVEALEECESWREGSYSHKRALFLRDEALALAKPLLGKKEEV